ncbi:MAG: response regulator [Burkholderiaceae bacterium]|jgi:two-component system chemotaxis response regulator CheY
MALSVLAVDDSSSMRFMVSKMLEDQGYKAVGAMDGEQALQAATAQSFDVIVTDQDMPRMDGVTLVEQLRKLPGYASTPILVLSSDDSLELRARGMAAGATQWLLKANDLGRLVKQVDFCCGR